MTWTQADLDAVEAAIRARMSGGAIDSYGIADRQLRYMPLDQLLKLRAEMSAEIAAATPGGARTYGMRRRPL